MERVFAHTAMLAATGFESFLVNGESLGEYFVNQADIYVKMKEQSNFVPLCKFLANVFQVNKSFLIFDEFGIWPSSENRYLYKSLYRYYTGIEFKDHSSAILFETDDVDALVSFLHLGFEFGWGGCVCNSKEKFLRFTHDSEIFIKCHGFLIEEITKFGAVRKVEKRHENK